MLCKTVLLPSNQACLVQIVTCTNPASACEILFSTKTWYRFAASVLCICHYWSMETGRIRQNNADGNRNWLLTQWWAQQFDVYAQPPWFCDGSVTSFFYRARHGLWPGLILALCLHTFFLLLIHLFYTMFTLNLTITLFS